MLPFCFIGDVTTPTKLTTESFIERAIQKHGDRFDYSEVEYINNYTPVVIICKKHGKLPVIPRDHLRNLTCWECSKESKALSIETVLQRFREVHGEKYSYPYFKEYSNNKQKIVVNCRVHGEFETSVSCHIKGHKCRKCSSDSYRLATEDFVSRAKQVHGDTYDYSLTQYYGAGKKVEIICPKHGPWKLLPNAHLSGRGCIKCSGRYRRSQEDYIKEASEKHNFKYQYERINFVNVNKKITITCPMHGDFEIIASKHLTELRGCPHCSNGGGYKRAKPGHFYILKHGNDIKVGITNRSVAERVKGLEKSINKSYQVFDYFAFKDGLMPYIIEQQVILLLKSKYRNPEEIFDGCTEYFVNGWEAIDHVYATIMQVIEHQHNKHMKCLN